MNVNLHLYKNIIIQEKQSDSQEISEISNPILLFSKMSKRPESLQIHLKDRLKKKHPKATVLIDDLFPKIIHQACENQKIPHQNLDDILLDTDHYQALKNELNTIVTSAEENNFSLLPEGLDPDIYDRIGFLFENKGITKNVACKKYFSSLVIKKNPAVFTTFRKDFQTVLDHIGKHAKEEEGQNPESSRLTNLSILIGNILSMYTYLNAPDGENLQVPQKVNGKWQTISYKVTWIPMTDKSLGEPYFALGLSPCIPIKAPPLLLFMGTTFPTSKGAYWSYLADITPGASVGELLYQKDKNENVKQWLIKTTEANEMKARVFGQSLGGALTFLTALRYPDLLEEVKAYAPAALTEKTLLQYKDSEPAIKAVTIEAFLNEGDIVPNAGGHYPPGCKIHRFIRREKYNPLYAHLKAMSGHKEYLSLRIEPHAVPKGKITTGHSFFSYFLFPIAISLFWLATKINKFITFLKTISYWFLNYCKSLKSS